MKNILKVRMLGGFTLEYKGKELVLDRNNVSKTTQLFQLLLLHTQDGGTEQMEKGKKKHTGTFVVHVSHCDNATWQGEVTWAEANKKKSFRSALELIRLIDGALEVDE